MIWTTQQRSKIGSLSVISRGKGPLVLMIHGVGLRAEAWAAQIDALAARYHVLAVDMPGHGESDRLSRSRDLAAYSDAIAPLLEAPAFVVGHSFGAMIALDLACRHALKVKAAVALNAIYKRDPAAKAAVQARARDLDGITMVDPSTPLIRWFGDAPSDARRACAQWLAGVDPAGYRDAYRVFAREDGPEENALAKLKCPALFVTGGKEPNSTPAMSRKMAALAPFGRADVVADAAHMLPMTHADEVTARLGAFFEENSQ